MNIFLKEYIDKIYVVVDIDYFITTFTLLKTMMFKKFGNEKKSNTSVDTMSATTREEYEQLASEQIPIILSQENDDWLPFKFHDSGLGSLSDVKVYEKEMPDTPIKGTKGTATIPSPASVVYELLWDVEQKKQIEKELLEVEIIETISPSIDIIRARYSAPFPVTPRELVVMRVKMEENGEYYIVSLSVSHPKCEETSKYVRASVTSAVIIRPHSAGCSVTRYNQLDPKGSVPAMAVNRTKTKVGDFLVTLREIVSKNNPEA
eukprot:TRINITY_DN180_c0_g1_i1.p1 TRINITY_DN180_c0_g1~~TRINITY_DN180_c0_g1_i1.p1  ORF type:complete len:262 (-),score=71.99 TRINITY_DN180_c0_g1_i1:69-854(-)